MKLAMGVFHFNVHYVAGDMQTYHRYCNEAIMPFLETLAAHPQYRTSVEMAGTSLEFLAANRPEAIALLRDLIERKQIELISATYAPTVWVAFPKRDLMKSIELNQACLSKLGLKASRIFLAQEAFFGPGLQEISAQFEAAICKDDYLRVLSSREISSPIYRLGELPVVVGCNHILNELATRVVKGTQSGEPPILSSFYEARLQEAVNSASHSAYDLIEGTIEDVQWHWYHLGSGHHFSTWASPLDWTSFFHDPAWMRLNIELLDDLISKGYRLSIVTEFIDSLRHYQVEALPPIIEGSWDPKKSGGIYAWMGKHEHHWENDAAILGLAWRSRDAVRESETMIESVEDPTRRPELETRLTEAWRQQILAESSDPLGWAPTPTELNFGRECAEETLRMCAALKAHISGCLRPNEKAESGSDQEFQLTERLTADRAAVSAELMGAEGTISWFSASDGVQMCETRFRAVEPECGVRFARMAGHVIYCPSGLEEHPATIKFDDIRQPAFYLPLANGLITLGDNLHLIRINRFGQIAVRVSKGDQWFTFGIEKAPEGRTYQWRFLVVRGTLQEATQIANKVNNI